jgi:hypothetical protein
LGFTLGEASALTFEHSLSRTTRVTAQAGIQHTAQPFTATLDAPMIGAGIESDVIALGPSMTLTAGFGATAWVRSHYLSRRPMLAIETPVGLRITPKGGTLSWRLAVVPRVAVLPGIFPHVGAFAGFSYALPNPRSARPDRAETPSEEDVSAQEKAKPKKAPAKRKPRRRGKRRSR